MEKLLGKVRHNWWDAEISEKRNICRKLFYETMYNGPHMYKYSYNGFSPLRTPHLINSIIIPNEVTRSNAF